MWAGPRPDTPLRAAIEEFARIDRHSHIARPTQVADNRVNRLCSSVSAREKLCEAAARALSWPDAVLPELEHVRQTAAVFEQRLTFVAFVPGTPAGLLAFTTGNLHLILQICLDSEGSDLRPVGRQMRLAICNLLHDARR